MHRRRVVEALVLALIVLLLGRLAQTGYARASATPDQIPRPNIVFILADDLDGRLGTVETMPNLQRLLVQQGTSVERFLISNPLCCPSRVSILRGQYVHNHEVFTNGPPTGGWEKFNTSGAENSTVATWLQNAGYRTVLLGKYLNGYPDNSQPTYIPPGWTEWISPSGGNPYSSYNYQMNENGQLVNYGSQPDDYITDVLTRKAVDFIQREADTPQPFFMYLATYAPHSPANPAPRHASLFPNAQVQRVPSYNEADVSDKPELIRRLPPLTPAEISDLDELYRQRLRSMQSVDDMIALVVGALQQTGQIDNTYIVFSSDNGYHIGHHRLRHGKAMAYEEDIRVPFIVRGPGVPVGETLGDYLVGNIDLAPTFAQLAGVTPPAYVDGRSLVPLFRTPRPMGWRQAFLIEQYPFTDNRPDQGRQNSGVLEPHDSDQDPDPNGVYVGLRTDRWKYVEWRTGEKELYDLLNDPYELDNQAASAPPEVLTQLSLWLSRLHQCAGAGCRVVEARLPSLVFLPHITMAD